VAAWKSSPARFATRLGCTSGNGTNRAAFVKEANNAFYR
jgi:hypothetical protein